MRSAKIAISLDAESLKEVSRSKLIQDAVEEKLRRFRRLRLEQECAKLQPENEKAEAEEFFAGEAGWPKY